MFPQVAFTPPSDKSYVLTGGLDMVTAPIKASPGVLIMGQNVEMVAGVEGYGRVEGYEPTDGRPLPSVATITLVVLKAGGVGTITKGTKFTGDTGLVAYPVHDSDNAADGYLTLYIPDTSLSPTDDEVFSDGVNSFIIKETSVTLLPLGDDRRVHRVEAISIAHDLTLEVPGSGPVRGVFRYKGNMYAFRDAADGLSKVLYKSSVAGWVAVPLLKLVYFKEGHDTEQKGFKAGEEVTDGTNTATVKAIAQWAGVWDPAQSAPDQATGYLVIEFTVGTSFAEAATLTSGTITAIADKESEQIKLNSGATNWDAIVYNFKAGAEYKGAYGTDGVNFAFELVDDLYVPIIPESYQDVYPEYVKSHQNRLYLGYTDGDLIYSSQSEPTIYNTVSGAGNWNTGDTIVGMRSLPSDTLGIFCEKSIWFVLGKTGENSFDRFKDEYGAVKGSVGGKDNPVFLNGSKLHTLQTTASYGGFNSGSIASQIQPWFAAKMGRSTVLSTMVCRKKSQYRLFYDDGTAIYVTLDGGKVKGATPVKLPHNVLCTWGSMESDGVEHMYFGADDGFVYKMDSGDAFNNEAIIGSMRLPFYHYGSPGNFKTFKRLIFELDSPVLLSGNTTVNFTLNFSYGNPDVPRGVVVETEVKGGGGFYDNDSIYGEFVWSGQPISTMEEYIEGVGKNMSILVNFSAKHDKPFLFHAAIVEFIKTGLTR